MRYMPIESCTHLPTYPPTCLLRCTLLASESAKAARTRAKPRLLRKDKICISLPGALKRNSGCPAHKNDGRRTGRNPRGVADVGGGGVAGAADDDGAVDVCTRVVGLMSRNSYDGDNLDGD